MSRDACGRCAAPEEDVVTFGIDGVEWEVKLCGGCAQRLRREIGGWARLGRRVVAPESAPSVFASPFPPAEDRRRTADLRAQQSAADRSMLPAGPATTTPPADDVGYLELADEIDYLEVALDWTLTAHARDRAKLRGYTINEVLAAAAYPDEPPSKQFRGGEWRTIHRRGDVAVAVNALDRVIITVLHRDAAKYEPDIERVIREGGGLARATSR